MWIYGLWSISISLYESLYESLCMNLYMNLYKNVYMNLWEHLFFIYGIRESSTCGVRVASYECLTCGVRDSQTCRVRDASWLSSSWHAEFVAPSYVEFVTSLYVDFVTPSDVACVTRWHVECLLHVLSSWLLDMWSSWWQCVCVCAVDVAKGLRAPLSWWCPSVEFVTPWHVLSSWLLSYGAGDASYEGLAPWYVEFVTPLPY